MSQNIQKTLGEWILVSRAAKPRKNQVAKSKEEIMRDFSALLTPILGVIQKEKPYTLELNNRSENVNDPEYPFGIKIVEKQINREIRIGDIGINLYYNHHGEPSILVGNFQGRNQEGIKRFKEKMREPVLNLVLRRIIETTRGKHERVLVVNPRKHYYRERLTSDILETEYQLNHGSHAYVSDQELEKERKEIITRATGMHTAAFKKMGFRKTSMNVWRRKGMRG